VRQPTRCSFPIGKIPARRRASKQVDKLESEGILNAFEFQAVINFFKGPTSGYTPEMISRWVKAMPPMLDVLQEVGVEFCERKQCHSAFAMLTADALSYSSPACRTGLSAKAGKGHLIMLGKKVAIWGKAVRIASATASIRKKGNMPRKTTSMGRSLATPAIA
jgi:hypothetical protein